MWIKSITQLIHCVLHRPCMLTMLFYIVRVCVCYCCAPPFRTRSALHKHLCTRMESRIQSIGSTICSYNQRSIQWSHAQRQLYVVLFEGLCTRERRLEWWQRHHIPGSEFKLSHVHRRAKHIRSDRFRYIHFQFNGSKFDTGSTAEMV